MEKQTDYIMLSTYKNTFGHTYKTVNNKQLFNTKIPDGWDIINNKYLIIIENKQKFNKKYYQEGLKQLIKYYNIAISSEKYIKNKYKIYLILGFGNNEETFKYYIFDDKKNITTLTIKCLYDIIFNDINSSSSDIQEIKINSSEEQNRTSNAQKIHNLLVKNFCFDKSNELYDILTIILLSFNDNELIEYYKHKDVSITNIDFKERIINVAKEYLENTSYYEKYFNAIRSTKFNYCFNICKTIYETYKNDPYSISSLYQQFKKYNKLTQDKNETWTEKPICDIMFKECEYYIKYLLNKQINDELITILDPCIGSNNLIKNFVKHYRNNIFIKGYEINKKTALFSNLDLTLSNFNNKTILPKDSMLSNNYELKNNICICNPPYTKNISNYEAIEFLAKFTHCSDMCCFIFPKQQITRDNLNKFKQEIIDNHYVTKVIYLGNKIFKTIANIDIIIIVTMNKNIYKQVYNKDYDNTLYIDLSKLSNNKYYKKVIRGSVYELTNLGKEYINNYYKLLNNENIEQTDIETYKYKIDSVKDWFYKIEQDNSEEYIKKMLLLQYCDKLKKEYIKSIDDIKTNILNNINIEYDKQLINSQNDNLITDNKYNYIIDNVINEQKQINKLNFKQYKLNELLESIKLNKDKYFVIKNCENGDIPLYGAAKENKPVISINNYSIDTDNYNDDIVKNNGVITINKNGSVGYCFRRKGKFAITSDLNIYKETELGKNILSDINLELIEQQLISQYSYTNKLTNKKFDDTIVFVIIT